MTVTTFAGLACAAAFSSALADLEGILSLACDAPSVDEQLSIVAETLIDEITR